MGYRSIVSKVLYAALLVAGSRPMFLKLLVPPHRLPHVQGPSNGIDRWPLRMRDDSTPLELRIFLELVRMQTRNGDRIALMLAPPHADFGYSYWRASYVLAGRTILLPAPYTNFAEADVVVAWGEEPAIEGFEIDWRGFGGSLARRRR